MSPPLLLLLSLLLLGSLGVCAAAPLDKGEEHPEELVTRCIVEVLSNALAKPNAPPIDPECREILKKSSRHNQDEKDNDVKQYETRNLKNVAITDGHHHKTSEEAKPENQETKFPEEEKKWHHTENESQEENEKRETNNEEDTGHSKERDFIDEALERIHHKEHIQSEEVSKEDREQAETSNENRHDITDEKVHEAAKGLEEASEENSRHSEDIMKTHHDNSKEHVTQPEKHHLSHSYEESKESDESEGEEERRYKPNHDMFGQRFLGYEEKRSHHTKQIDSSERTEGEEKRHNTLNAFEDRVKKNHYEAKGHNDIQSSEESKEKIHLHRGSEEVRDQSYDSEDNSKEYKRHPNTEEERHYEEKKRWPIEKSEEDKLNYEHSQEDSEENIEKRHAKDRKLKEELFEKLRRHLLEGSDEQPYTHERKAEDKKRYVSEAMAEVKRNYPEQDEEKINQHYNDERRSHRYGNNKDDFEESNNFDNQKYKRHHPEYERRINRYGFPDEIKWKNRFYDKEDDQTYDSEEENKNNLQNKNVFPEFSDYDWWGKKQLLDGTNHGYAEKRSSPKMHKFDMKRQYDRMDELAQLLNYKKKSVEFPDFYDSEEIKKRNLNDRGSLGQRPLTEEEEKDLENLAIMDLELQKIAEKLSNSRQG
ncbi:secretogranin-1 [Xenopus laevis]|uniref:Secretogranin-1 n=2 Tax=Xenopus laevis TaxID=8355 RepID=A0A974HIM7_XENLA|nr:secretogranin-1 [Xenopus laevis]OCT79265.1 hypothetical protein XELAEV_18026075mg [Xenopus laevis]